MPDAHLLAVGNFGDGGAAADATLDLEAWRRASQNFSVVAVTHNNIYMQDICNTIRY